MKAFLKNLIIVCILAVLFINSSFLKVVSIAINDVSKIIDKNKINLAYEINIQKYVNYSIEEEKGTLVQLDLKSGIEYLEEIDYDRITSTETSLRLPKIENEYPESVEIIELPTHETNGSKIEKDFKYQYDKENGNIEIIVENNEEISDYNQNIKESKDEYTIICYYSSNCYKEEREERELSILGNIKTNISNDIQIKKDVEENFFVTENISEIVSTNIKTSEIYNGYIKANKENGTNYNTEFIENVEMNISKKDISDEIFLNIENVFLDNKDNIFEVDDIVYKSTKVSKENLQNVLGEDGYLQILNINGDILADINKDTEFEDNGIYEFIYDHDIDKIIVKTSKPLNVGTILLQNKREIKSNVINTDIDKIYYQNTIECIKQDVERKRIHNCLDYHIIEIKEAVSKIDLSVDTINWTNNIQNDVIFKATLVTTDNKNNLFKNPSIEIKLPKQVEKVILQEASLLYANGLEIEKTGIVEENDYKIIRVELNGEQIEYCKNSMTSGTELLIPATIIIEKESISEETSIEYTYTNEIGNINDYNVEGNENKQINVNIKNVLNFQQNLSVVNDENNKENNENNETESTNKLTIDVKAQVGKDILKENDIVYQGEAISFSVKLKNETEEVINNIKGIYQLPDGLVYATRNERFSNENLEGTISGNKTNRLWNINKDISQCEINRDFLAPGEVYEVVYDILVEEMTEETTIENIFEFFVEEQKVNEQKMSFIYKSAKIRVDAFNPVDLNNGSGYYYNYYLEVNNLTNETLRDVTVKIFIGKELEYLAVTGYFDENDYDNETGTVTVKYNEMEANKITSIKLLVEANKFEDYKYDYDVELYALSYMNEETYRSNLVVKEVEVAKISIIQTSEQEGLTLKYGDEIEYNFVVKNEGKIPALIKITDDLPEGLIPVSAEYEYYDWNEDKKEYEKRIENLDISQQVEAEGEQQEDFKIDIIIPEQKTMQIKIKCEVDLLYEDKDVINVATIVGEDVFTRTSNGIKNKLLHYNFEEIEDPEQPENPDNPDNPNKPDYPEEPDNPNNPDNPEEPDNPNNPDNPDNPDNPYNPDTPDKPDKPNVENKYNISGVIWIDENKNGQREEREELLSGIIVKLFDIETGAIVVDKDNNIKKVTTDKNGYYEFKDIKEGKYIVLFQYDTDKYDITTYQQKSVSETKNSDAIEKEVNIDGKILNVGVTDTIILNKNYDNIDMGLTVEHKFDLKLDKYVSEVIVKNSKEEKIYEFNNSKLAKVEIPAKQINSTEIDIKYKIVVTNEGNVSGFAKEIIDYIPEGLEYNALINNIKWDKTNNGSIVTKELADKRIEPGESREVTLVLTVKGKVARIINSAEIGNTDNVYKLKDIDSTENNKNKAEDDYSEAEFIVSVKTGVVINVIRIIGILIVLIVLVYLCISKKINKKMLVFVLFSTIICTIGTSTKAEVVLTTVSSGSYRGQPDYVIITVHDVGYIAIWAGNNPCWKYMNLAYGHDATAQNSRGSYLKDLYTCTSISDHETCGDYKSDNPTNHLYRLNQSASKIYYDFKSLVNGLGGGQYWQQKYNSSGYYPEDPDYDNRPLAIKMGFKEKDFEIPGTTVSTSKNEIDINTHEYVEDKVFIGPFYFTSSSSNSEYELDNYNTLVVRDNNGKTINYEIYDGNNYSSNKITNKQISNLQGKNFYLLVDDVLKGIQVTANIQYTISKSVSKVYALHYDACGKSDPKFKDDTIREYYDLCAECNNETSHPQSYTKAKVESRYETKTVSKQLKWVVDMPKGKIEVTKKDTDSNQMISGATIRLDGINVEYSKTVTMTSGTYLFENLIPGNYKVTEIGAPSGYDLNLQNELGTTVVTASVLNGRTTPVTIKNRKFTNIVINKKVFQKEATMDGVEFYIYVQTADGNGYLTRDNGKENGILKPSTLISSKNNATKFTTNSSGDIILNNMPMGTYRIEEVNLPDKYKPWYNMSGIITLDTNNGNYLEGFRVVVQDVIKRGHLILMKTDYDTKQKLDGAQFNITNNLNPTDPRYINMNVTIPDTRILRIDNLPIGNYVITETKAPSNYNLELQLIKKEVIVQEDKTAIQESQQNPNSYPITSVATGNGIVTVEYKNRLYGNLKIQKIDKDTGKTSLEDLVLQNIDFVISYSLPGETTKRYMAELKEYDSGEKKYEIIPTTTGNVTGAKIFTTKGEDSAFEIDNLPQYYNYYIEEIKLPDEIAQYYDIREPYEVKLDNNYNGASTPVVTMRQVDNKQIRVDITGYVWEDIGDGKETVRDNLYINGSKDKKVQGLKVFLKKNGQVISETITGAQGEYLFEAKGSNYEIVIEQLSQYSVQFEYNGLKYEKVVKNLDSENGSKVMEMEQDRNGINEKFYNVQKDRTGLEVKLKYSKPILGTSELIQNTGYTAQSLEGSVDPQNSALMVADTTTAGYQIKWNAGIRRVKDINLGIFERSQPDLAIATDIEDIQLTINGSYSHTYEYKSRSPYMNNTGIPDKDINPGYDAVLDGFSVGVKRGNGTYNCSYTREIYDSYIAYTKANKDRNDRLRVFVKYNIAIKNESGSLISRASLKNYADSRLNYSYSYYLDGNGNQVPVNWNLAGNGVWQSEEVKADIAPSECIYVYLVYELNTDTIIEMANLKDGETLKMDDNITEISSYSTWDKNGNRYGGIDKDSAPDNIQKGNFDTYEDDTDVAPGLEFKRKDSKVISGLVYEDYTNLGPELKTGEERKGNGIYDNGEKTLSNVDVQIIDCNGNNTTKLYNLDRAGNVIITDAKYMTGNNGEFSFTGLVPGKYRVQYIYGRYNGSTQSKIDDSLEVTTESYKSTIVDANRFEELINNGYDKDYDPNDPNELWYWYQKADNFNYSSAVDDYSRREMINSNLSTINYNTKTNYENKTDSPENHYMIANTGVMDFPIEDTRIQTTDINYIQGSREYKLKFGIAERPRQSIELNKEISHICITLANGQILVDGDPRTQKMNYVQYLKRGALKIEVDTEIIQGAKIDIQYEISIKNNSELDYNHIKYYRYGSKDNDVLSKIVQINLDAIVDYADEKLSVTEYLEENTDRVTYNWELITNIAKEKNKLVGIEIEDKVYNALNSSKRSNILVLKDNNSAIRPGQEEKVYLKASKLLTDTEDSDSFDNYAEILQVSNPVGRFYGIVTNDLKWEYHTPGNFDVSKKTPSESDNNDYKRNDVYTSKVIIIPPTGIEKIVIYCSIVAVCLIVLAGGIVLIKKCVKRD